MAFKSGFLLIELMLALFLIMCLWIAIVRLEGSIVLMQAQIVARNQVIESLRMVIEQGSRSGKGHVRQKNSVDVMPSHRLHDKNLPLCVIRIKPRDSRQHIKLSTTGWLYE